MKRLTLCLLLFLAGVHNGWSQDKVNLDRLERYIIDNYSLPESLKSDCHYNHIAMVLESNSKGEITGMRYLNEAHPDLKASLAYVKKFRFDASMRVKSRPILFFATIDQQNRKRCPYLYHFHVTPNKITAEIVQIVMKQLESDPQTILMNAFRFVDPVLPSAAPALTPATPDRR